MNAKIVFLMGIIIASAAPLTAETPPEFTAAISEVKAQFNEQFKRFEMQMAELKETNRALQQKVDSLERALENKITLEKPLEDTCVKCDSSTGATTMGHSTTATGNYSTALGRATTALGEDSTAMGYSTTAKGDYSTTIGAATTAKGFASTAMGHGGEATEDASLHVSGKVFAANVGIRADERLTTNLTTTPPALMLAALRRLRVVEYSATHNLCCHSHGCSTECELARHVGLIAQEVERAMPGATSSGSSLKLMKPDGRHSAVLEHVPDVRSLDLHTLLATLVGAIQHLSQLHD